MIMIALQECGLSFATVTQCKGEEHLQKGNFLSNERLLTQKVFAKPSNWCDYLNLEYFVDKLRISQILHDPKAEFTQEAARHSIFKKPNASVHN